MASLILELDFVAFTLLLLMLYNVRSLYKSRLNTPLSRLLIAGLLLCVCEALWEYFHSVLGNQFLADIDGVVFTDIILFIFVFFLR